MGKSVEIVRVEKANEEDITVLVDLVHTMYRTEESFKGWTSEATYIKGPRTNNAEMKRNMDTPGTAIFKGVNERNEIVACVMGDKNILLDEEGKTEEIMHLGMFCVRPEYECKGVGKLMIQAVVDFAKLEGCEIVLAHVIKARKPLVGWYERQGFVNKGTIPFPTGNEFYGTPISLPLDLLEMEKEVPQ